MLHYGPVQRENVYTSEEQHKCLLMSGWVSSEVNPLVDFAVGYEANSKPVLGERSKERLRIGSAFQGEHHPIRVNEVSHCLSLTTRQAALRARCGSRRRSSGK